MTALTRPTHGAPLHSWFAASTPSVSLPTLSARALLQQFERAQRIGTFAVSIDGLIPVSNVVVTDSPAMAIFFVALIPWGLGLMVVIPMMVISTYFGYRDVFESDAKKAA